MNTAIKNPTIRKIRNRGWTPIRYQLPDNSGLRWGWQMGENSKGRIHIRLVGEERSRWLHPEEGRFITELGGN